MNNPAKIYFFAFAMLLFLRLIFFPANISISSESGRHAVDLPLDPEFQPQAGTYHYQVSWNKAHVGTARIIIERENDLYHILVQAKTNKKLDRIYKVRYRGESKIAQDPVTPIEARIQERIGSSRKEATIEYHENREIVSTETRIEKGKPAEETVRNLQAENFALDPFSATFLVRHLDWETGMEEVFDVFTGRDQYLLRLQCIRKTSIAAAGSEREAWEIVPQLTKQDEKEQQKGEKEMSDMLIYISADAARELLKIKVSLRVGHFRIQLEKFEPADPHWQ